MRFLLVVPRFGPDIVGGAERLAWELATRAIGPDDVMEVATTCAIDHHTWINHHPPGTETIAGLQVHRFEVGRRDSRRHAELVGRLNSKGSLTYTEELELLGHDVWSPTMQAFLEKRGDQYDLILFMPYLFGTTFWGVQAWPERSALVPCLHDEPAAHMSVMRQLFRSCAGCLFNTAAEQRLAERLYGPLPGGVVGMGFDPVSSHLSTARDAMTNLGNYFLYAGRLEEAKRVPVIVEYVERFAKQRNAHVKLVLIGRGPYSPPDSATHVVNLGWVDEAEKFALMRDSVALVHPSELESLSIVLMEAWRAGTPAIVAAGSEVMHDHCTASGGGITFSNYQQFSHAADRLLTDAPGREQMAQAGKAYVVEGHSWGAVRRRFSSVTKGLCGAVDRTQRPGSEAL
jgi:glycosyltransferase involved in cell wall biosynthesis